jgi:hypothetical protein
MLSTIRDRRQLPHGKFALDLDCGHTTVCDESRTPLGCMTVGHSARCSHCSVVEWERLQVGQFYRIYLTAIVGGAGLDYVSAQYVGRLAGNGRWRYRFWLKSVLELEPMDVVRLERT